MKLDLARGRADLGSQSIDDGTRALGRAAGENDVAVVERELACGDEADARVGAGDNGDLAGEVGDIVEGEGHVGNGGDSQVNAECRRLHRMFVYGARIFEQSIRCLGGGRIDEAMCNRLWQCPIDSLKRSVDNVVLTAIKTTNVLSNELQWCYWRSKS